ncbi:putative ABC transporter permease subunit [Paenibacillus tengchongensis]|uniref:putative ABC transporter permease subunit n=1 Tax=Paenibacillus tengchongensis TaxID=2608684 RepID=UPI00124D3F5A|nr:hypothetical protein [Paenibacillus tengchongensis]
MINIWRLTRVQLLSSFGLNKALHTRDRKERNNLLLLGAAILLCVVMLAAFSFGYSYMLAQTLESIGRVDLLLALMMAVTSLIGFFTTVYKAGGVLFGFKDYDLVMSLPVKTSTVVASRVLQLYSLNVFFTLLVMVPAGAVYAIYVNPGFLYYPLFLLTLLCIPLVPIIAATIIGALISWIASRFRGSRTVQLVLTIAFVIALMAGSFSINKQEQVQVLADLGAELAESVFRLYPLASMYVGAVCSYKAGSLLLFVGISLLAFLLFTYVLGSRFKAIHTGLTTSRASRNYRMKSLKTSTPLRALYRKELRRYFSSSVYVMNTGIGMIMLLVMAVALLFVSADQLGELVEVPQLADYLNTLAPLVVSVFVTLSCTTSSSISIEGKNLWILQSSPVPAHTILLSKIAVNLTVTLPVLVISWGLLSLSLRTGWVESLLLLVIPAIYACYSAMLGVLVNLKLPNLEWTSEVTAIKQSAAVIVAMLIGFISLAVPFAAALLLPGVDGNLLLAAIGLVLLAVCGGMYRTLQTRGERMFRGL